MQHRLERFQVWIYLAAIGLGLTVGTVAPAGGAALQVLVWPVLGLLLYATFTQVPLAHLPATVQDWRFPCALLLGNFLILPLLVWGLLWLLPAEPAIRLGVLLVLLVPCTDWFISFTHLGRGDTGRAIAATPLLLLGQLLMLPVYLWLFLGEAVVQLAVGTHLLLAFAGLILLPLLLAWLTERAAERRGNARRIVAGLAWLPVPLLAMVVFLIAASQVQLVSGMLEVLARVLLVFLLFLVLAAALGKALGHLFGLAPAPTRTLVFSFGTRNSFVVLPLALALSESWEAAVVVIVFQSLVELFGMAAYLHWVPRRLVPARPPG
ncbi:MAG: arsenic resistance protein [Ectothiorhodospiraceae bacterium]|nr:arsenic resistance protein [Ectothiorhodospiraceae bacterium]